MTLPLNLDPEFRSLISDLAALDMEHRAATEADTRAQLARWLGSEVRRVEVLRDNLERVLADCEYRDIYLAFLGRLQAKSRPLRHFAILDDRRKVGVLKHGLTALEPADLAVLAIDPVVLADVWDAVSADFPPYWEQAVRCADELSARARRVPPLDARAISRRVVASLFPETAADLEAADEGDVDREVPNATWHDPVSSGSELALASFGTGHQPSVGPPSGDFAWSDEIPFTSIEILAVHNQGELELRQSLAVHVEYRWQPAAHHGPLLRVWLSGALILTRADCSARLLDSQSVERAWASVQDHALTFTLADVQRPEALAGWAMLCDYHKENLFDARFTAKLRPPCNGSGHTLEPR